MPNNKDKARKCGPCHRPFTAAPAASRRGAAAPATSADPALVEPVLRELIGLLRGDDMAADACLGRLEALLGATSQDDLARVRELVDNLEFAEALEPLARIAAALGIAAEA